MSVFSIHLAKVPVATALRALLCAPTSGDVSGLRHAECMTVMQLGAPVLSPARMQLRRLAVFASWESERFLDAFLANTDLGRVLAAGWHVRLEFVRRWGSVAEFADLPETVGELAPNEPVVAVTLARMRLPQVPRFIRWGKPVEEQVRDHPGKSLALAAIRLPRTVSTITVWRTQEQMLSMVHGRDSTAGGKRHANAMVERKRKDFHFEFTTLRFRALVEKGTWDGRSNIVSGTGFS